MVMDGVVDISTIKPELDDIILIKIDYGKLPSHIRTSHSENMLKYAKQIFPKNKIVIMSAKDSISLEKDSLE